MAQTGSLRDRVSSLVAGPVATVGLDLEQVSVTMAGRRRVVRVVVDGDGGVTSDQLAEVSRLVSAALDADDPFGEGAYVLEVSTPGVDRPLTERRHWRRAVGRLVRVELVTGAPVIGRLAAVADDGISVAGPASSDGPTELAWETVRQGRVQVEFDRPDQDWSALDETAEEPDGEALT